MDFPTYLVIDSGPAGGRRIPLTPDGITVGRQAGNDLVIPDAQLSREHARFDLGSAGPTVTDLDSANGTTVNGRPLTGSKVLWPGDVVAFGDSTARVAWPERADAVLPPALATPLASGPGEGTPPRPVLPPPPVAARPTRPLLLVGALVGVLALVCLCGGGAVVALAGLSDGTSDAPTAPRSAGNTFPTVAAGSGRAPTVAGGASGGAPTPATGGGQGGGGVPVGDYRCRAYGGQAVGYITNGGVHIHAGNKVSYSTDGVPVAGAQQYRYTFDTGSQAIAFQGGPYDGKQGSYLPQYRSLQIGATNCDPLP